MMKTGCKSQARLDFCTNLQASLDPNATEDKDTEL